MKEEKQRPACRLLGEDGNIFNLMGVASRALKKAGMRNEAKEMCKKVMKTHSYGEALNTICEYVDVE